ncbi:MAG: hypothetical protein AB1472_06720, partial [Candidatus Omnitrophota bacterium]
PEITDQEEERLADIFGQAFSRGIANVPGDLLDEIDTIDNHLNINLKQALNTQPQTLEELLNQLRIQVEIEAKTPSEMQVIKQRIEGEKQEGEHVEVRAQVKDNFPQVLQIGEEVVIIEGKVRDRNGYGFAGGVLTKVESAYQDYLFSHLTGFGLTNNEINAIANAIVRIKEDAMYTRKEFFTADDIRYILNYRVFDITRFIARLRTEQEKYKQAKDNKGKNLFKDQEIHQLLFRKIIPFSWIDGLMQDGLSKTEATRIVTHWSNPKQTWEKTLKPIRDKLMQDDLSKAEATYVVVYYSNPKEKIEAINKTIPLIRSILTLSDETIFWYLIKTSYQTIRAELRDKYNIQNEVDLDNILTYLKAYEEEYGKLAIQQTPSSAAQAVQSLVLSNEQAGEYIEKNLPNELRGTSVEQRQAKLQAQLRAQNPNIYEINGIVFIKIKGLFKATGQFAHIGLGQTYGQSVVYIDEEYANNQIVVNHELEEISLWNQAVVQRRYGAQVTNLSQVRNWMRQNPQEAITLAQELHQQANRKYNVDTIVPATQLIILRDGVEELIQTQIPSVAATRESSSKPQKEAIKKLIQGISLRDKNDRKQLGRELALISDILLAIDQLFKNNDSYSAGQLAIEAIKANIPGVTSSQVTQAIDQLFKNNNPRSAGQLAIEAIKANIPGVTSTQVTKWIDQLFKNNNPRSAGQLALAMAGEIKFKFTKKIDSVFEVLKDRKVFPEGSLILNSKVISYALEQDKLSDLESVLISILENPEILSFINFLDNILGWDTLLSEIFQEKGVRSFVKFYNAIYPFIFRDTLPEDLDLKDSKVRAVLDAILHFSSSKFKRTDLTIEEIYQAYLKDYKAGRIKPLPEGIPKTKTIEVATGRKQELTRDAQEYYQKMMQSAQQALVAIDSLKKGTIDNLYKDPVVKLVALIDERIAALTKKQTSELKQKATAAIDAQIQILRQVREKIQPAA